MKERKAYKGTLKGVKGIWCDKKPRGLELDETITWYSADEGKVFKKGDEFFNSVIIKDGVNIEDFEEVEDTSEEFKKEPEEKSEQTEE